MLSFSIITVCRNAATTIASALDSVAAQRHGAVQHIVIDGASTDDTATVAKAHMRASGIVVSEADNGIYDAMNKGLARATGDVVAFLNADDHYAHADVLGAVAADLERSGADALFGDVAFFDPAAPDVVVRRYRSGHFRPSRLRWGWMPAHPATFVRRAAYDAVGGFRQDFRIAADFDMTIRLFADGRHSYVHRDEVLTRMATGGVSTRGLAAAMTINRECAQACRDHGIYSNQAMIMTKYARKLLERL